MNGKSPILKCKLIGFELELKNQSRYNFPTKTILQFAIKTHSSFQREKQGFFLEQTINFWLFEYRKNCFVYPTQERRKVSFYHWWYVR